MCYLGDTYYITKLFVLILPSLKGTDKCDKLYTMVLELCVKCSCCKVADKRNCGCVLIACVQWSCGMLN